MEAYMGDTIYTLNNKYLILFPNPGKHRKEASTYYK